MSKLLEQISFIFARAQSFSHARFGQLSKCSSLDCPRAISGNCDQRTDTAYYITKASKGKDCRTPFVEPICVNNAKIFTEPTNESYLTNSLTEAVNGTNSSSVLKTTTSRGIKKSIKENYGIHQLGKEWLSLLLNSLLYAVTQNPFKGTPQIYSRHFLLSIKHPRTPGLSNSNLKMFIQHRSVGLNFIHFTQVIPCWAIAITFIPKSFAGHVRDLRQYNRFGMKVDGT